MEPIVQYIVIGIYTFFTVGVYVYQANRYSALEKSIKSLNEILDAVNKYKDIFKPDDIINRLTTKHEIEKQTFEAQLKKEMDEKINENKVNFGKEVSDKMTGIIMEMNKSLMGKYTEFAKHSINIIITDKVFSSDKVQRDKLIKDLFPLNSETLIETCDILLANKKKDEKP